MNQKQKIYTKMRRGFSFIEMIVVLTLFVTINMSVGFLIFQGYKYWNLIREQEKVQEQIKINLTEMGKNIREVKTAETGAYPIKEALPLSLTFYANFDTDTPVERIRYFLDGTNLKRGITESTGNPPAYNDPDEKIETIASFVRNDDINPIFTYFDENYSGSAQSLPLPSPVEIKNIRLIRINLTIDVDTVKNPLPYSLETEISLRNLKTNL